MKKFSLKKILILSAVVAAGNFFGSVPEAYAATLTCYFNAHSSSGFTNPNNMDDGNTGTVATNNVDNTTHVFSGNSCGTTNLGTITQVQVRQYAFHNSSTIRTDFTPKFNGSNGTRFDWGNWEGTSGAFSSYYDITSDTNAPSTWTWTDIGNLTGTMTNNRPNSGNNSVAKVEILITYTQSAPTLTTGTAFSVSYYNAALAGTISDTGGVSPTTRGFAWGTSSTLGAGVATTSESGTFSTGSFSTVGPLTGLSCGTTYYYRAYATNTVGTGYGTIQAFTTLACNATNAHTIFLTSGTSWTVPNDWSSTNNTVEVIGGGGGGTGGLTTGGAGAGGGGGGYSKISNLSLTPGASIVIQVGSGGAASTSGTDTFFNRTSGSANTCADTSSVCAKGGGGGIANSTGGAGGDAASGIGTTKYSGGAGGNGPTWGGAGGGGAGGPNGNGASGAGANNGATGGFGGGGGGGGSAGSNAASTAGGNGGNNSYASGGGLGVSTGNGNPGAYGGGGGGAGGGSAGVGGAGGNGVEWDSGHGSGGGGGGGSNSAGGGPVGGDGGRGGLYGGGGGGGERVATTPGVGGVGAQGIIVITYAPTSVGRTLRLFSSIGAGNILRIRGSVSSTLWYSQSWSNRVKITVDHAKVGSGGVSSFPVYVNLADLTGGSFWSTVRSDCGDIRITNSSGTELPREVVSCNTGTNTGELWFKADSISNSADTIFYLYYGNSGAADYATNATYGAQNVWDSNFKGVWHLPNGSSLILGDSTSNANNGTNNNSVTATAGQTDGGANFVSASSQNISAGADSSMANLNRSAATYTFWINPASSQNMTVLAKNDNNATNAGWWIQTYVTGGTLRIALVSENSTNNMYAYSATAISTGAWTKVDVVGDGSQTAANQRFYINGALVTTTATQNGSGTTGDDSSQTLFVGLPRPTTTTPLGAVGYFNGKLDEIRLSNTARSSTWITTEYNNQNSPSTFYSLSYSSVPSAASFLNRSVIIHSH